MQPRAGTASILRHGLSPAPGPRERAPGAGRRPRRTWPRSVPSGAGRGAALHGISAQACAGTDRRTRAATPPGRSRTEPRTGSRHSPGTASDTVSTSANCRTVSRPSHRDRSRTGPRTGPSAHAGRAARPGPRDRHHQHGLPYGRTAGRTPHPEHRPPASPPPPCRRGAKPTAPAGPAARRKHPPQATGPVAAGTATAGPPPARRPQPRGSAGSLTCVRTRCGHGRRWHAAQGAGGSDSQRSGSGSPHGARNRAAAQGAGDPHPCGRRTAPNRDAPHRTAMDRAAPRRTAPRRTGAGRAGPGRMPLGRSAFRPRGPSGRRCAAAAQVSGRQTLSGTGARPRTQPPCRKASSGRRSRGFRARRPRAGTRASCRGVDGHRPGAGEGGPGGQERAGWGCGGRAALPGVRPISAPTRSPRSAAMSRRARTAGVAMLGQMCW